MREIRDRYVQSPLEDGIDEETWLEPESGTEVLRRAGFEKVSVVTEAFAGRFAVPEEALAWSLAWPVGAARVATLHTEARASFLAEVRQALARSDLGWRFVFNFYVGEQGFAVGAPSERGGPAQN
jgi:hypothetical protein